MSDVDRYLKLTRETMPALAKDRGWPVSADHCFQRIVLDHIAGGTWYDHIPRPAYKHLSESQARAAVALCEDILNGKANLHALNRQSLIWRGKAT
ncbi:MAG: hypothetical protein AAGA47_08215 [Pseudomonadota bacterium]